MNPSSAKKEMATEAAAAVKRGLRNRLTSIIGLAGRSSATTSRPKATTPAASTPMVAAEAQPHSGARMMPYTIRLIPAVDRAKPRQATRGVRGAPGGAGAAGGGPPPGAEPPHPPRDGDQEQEDAPPPELVKQPAAGDRPQRDPDAGAGPPHADGQRPLPPFGEHVGQQRQRGWE